MIEASVGAETISALAAFFSGIGTVLTGWFALRYERKRSKEECEERFAALHQGLKMGKEMRGSEKE